MSAVGSTAVKPTAHTPVLVVGGSLVGLSTSLLLANHRVPHLLVESHTGTAIHPRAASFHQRSMEIFRSAGVQTDVETAAAREFRQNGAIVAVESLGGKELQYFSRSWNDGVEDLSPTARLFITQVGLEPVLRERSSELGAEHRFGTELVSFEQRDDHVASVIRPRGGGPEQTVTSDYLVAADGAHSPVRTRLGIPMTGRGSFADCITIYFKADVRHLIGDRNLSVVYVNNPGLLGFFRFSITGDSGFLAVFATIDADGNRSTRVADDTSNARCIDLVRTALGSSPDLPVDIENVQLWTASAATAESLQRGRVFLAGDAAHVMPPTGGFGGNTGVADAHNLAWKLVMTTQGTAGAALLDTYEAERRPIAALTVEQAYTRYVLRVDPSLGQDDLMSPLDDPSIELGAVYSSAAVRPERPHEGPVDDPRLRSWTVGARVPHVPVRADGRQASTLDLCDSGFALLVTEGRDTWLRAVDDVERVLGIPVSVPDLQADGPDRRGEPLTTESSFGSCALVRPDGVLAWKTSASADQAAQHLPGIVADVVGVPHP
jgi:2-polyprenyl-6-methoxyphenol hydroxylase-like FAD-dependent oxidoreductase